MFFCKNFKKQLKKVPLIYFRNFSYRVLFFGNDTFSLYSLQELYLLFQTKNKIGQLDIVSSTTKTNPVTEFAMQKKLHLMPYPPEADTLTRSGYHIGIVVSFGHLIPQKVIQSFPLGMINVHASLLPRWRGASPIIHCVLNGEETTGVSIMQIRPHRFDTGEIIYQESCTIGSDELMPSLHERLGVLGAKCLRLTVETLPESLNNKVSQNDVLATFAPRINKSVIAEVKWKEKTSKEVYNLFRALYSIVDLKTYWYGIPVKLKSLTESRLVSQNASPGSVSWHRPSQSLIVSCKSGAIQVYELTVGGKKLRAVDFYNGYLTKRRENLWTFHDVY